MSSGHQLFGLVVFVLILFQFGIGFYHHLQYRKFQRPTMYGKVHRYAGPAIVLGGIINGFTGFNLSGESRNNIFYGSIVAVIIVTVLLILGWKRWSKGRQMKSSESTASVDGDQSTSFVLGPLPGSNDMR
jgi:hypothetical protein